MTKVSSKNLLALGINGDCQQASNKGVVDLGHFSVTLRDVLQQFSTIVSISNKWSCPIYNKLFSNLK